MTLSDISEEMPLTDAIETNDDNRCFNILHHSGTEYFAPQPSPVWKNRYLPSRLNRFKQIALGLGFLTILVLFLVLSTWITKGNLLMLEKHDICWCGNTVADAVSLGCRYDDIAGDWLPAKCIDNDLLVEFSLAGPGPGGGWQYYKDREGEEEIHMSNMSDYTISFGSYFGTRRWHASHCLYTWRKQFRSFRLGNSIVEPYDDTEEHVIHCTEIILKQISNPDQVEWLVPGKRDPRTEHGKQGHGGKEVV